MANPIVSNIDSQYREWLSEIKSDYRRSQIKAAVKVNEELLRFYWRLGRGIAQLHFDAEWGSGFYEALSKDLKEALPDSKGFAVSNLRYMRRYYELFPVFPIRPQVECEIGDAAIRPQAEGEIMARVGEQIFMIPWNHIKYILDKCGGKQAKALFYVQETIKNNWSRAVLLNFLGTDLYERKGKAITNFELTLPREGGDLAKQITKDPYNFDFLVLRKEYDEKELKSALISNIERFLLELGKGFAYMGREYRLNLGEEEEFCDMLFYNTLAHAYVVVEVKVEKLKPADLGQLGTYVVAVDHTLRGESDNKTIGLLICRDKNETTARYALESSSQPLGISSYELSTLVPEEFKGSLPTIEELESEIVGPEVVPPTNVYAETIKARRNEIGMTQQELADICKMPQPSIARIESGDSSPNLSTLLKICEALGLKIKIES
jgi:predicted nuclease of restriction endonuclease-like (RecB) superfamily/DNA-binding XRE family transcriptional regulator